MTPPQQLTLHRRQIHVDTDGDVNALLNAVSPLMQAEQVDGVPGPFSIVNIGVEGGAPLRLFCRANVSAVLAAHAGTLTVELAPTPQYVQFASQGIDLTRSVADAVAAMLRTEPVATCVPQVTELRQRLELMALLVDGYGLQVGSLRLAELAQRIGQGARTLLACTGHGDNSACLDALRYELLPALDDVAHRLAGARPIS